MPRKPHEPPPVYTWTDLVEVNTQHESVQRLSPREREVFALVVTGRSNIEAAAAMKLSVKTVETHRSHINRKLGVASTGALILYGVGLGSVRQRPQ